MLPYIVYVFEMSGGIDVQRAVDQARHSATANGHAQAPLSLKAAYQAAVPCNLALTREAKAEVTAHTDFLIRFTERNSATQDHAVIAGFRDVIRNVHERDVGFNGAKDASLECCA